jgi:hypothetical protein
MRPRKFKIKKCQILRDVKPKSLPTSVLPSGRDVILYYSFVVNELWATGKKPKIIGSKAINTVADEVIILWDKASIPTASSQNVAWAIGKLVQEQAKLLKKPVKKRKMPSFITQLEKFKVKCEELFDIAACKCQDLKSCVCARIYKVCVGNQESMPECSCT